MRRRLEHLEETGGYILASKLKSYKRKLQLAVDSICLDDLELIDLPPYMKEFRRCVRQCDGMIADIMASEGELRPKDLTQKTKPFNDLERDIQSLKEKTLKTEEIEEERLREEVKMRAKEALEELVQFGLEDGCCLFKAQPSTKNLFVYNMKKNTLMTISVRKIFPKNGGMGYAHVANTIYCAGGFNGNDFEKFLLQFWMDGREK